MDSPSVPCPYFPLFNLYFYKKLSLYIHIPNTLFGKKLASVETALVETALVETALVAPGYAGTSRICGKIKKSNVLHYICHFPSDKNNL